MVIPGSAAYGPVVSGPEGKILPDDPEFIVTPLVYTPAYGLSRDGAPSYISEITTLYVCVFCRPLL